MTSYSHCMLQHYIIMHEAAWNETSVIILSMVEKTQRKDPCALTLMLTFESSMILIQLPQIQ